MKSKKSEKASLEKNKIVYILMGFIFVLSLCFVALEWGDEVKKIIPISDIWDGIPDDLDIPQTQQQTPPPPPPQIQEINALIVVDDNKEVESVDITSEDIKTDEVIIAPPVEEIPDEDPDPDDVIFRVVEVKPEFPGGDKALFKYLSENVKYPVMAQENGIQGKVVCQFVINKDGSIVDIEVVRSAGDPSLDKEAVRVIKSMPKWKPGKQRNQPVRVKFTLPVNFRLQ